MNEMKKHNHISLRRCFLHIPPLTLHMLIVRLLLSNLLRSGGRISRQRAWVAEWKRTATKAQCKLQVCFQVRMR